ncbi:MAG: B12-binding domain-containing radical SAM protein [Coriobacteriales bacterium]|jgi:radical SAM superfamily enzyme YgiQ (UPF0313 family)|nr:B12-binding domain-containing radical SAM protein [Coriobacteriales bacterium]
MRAPSLWERIEPLLPLVEKPSRYLGCERNAVTGNRNAVTGGNCNLPNAAADGVYRVALLYPDVYENGQSDHAMAILYHIINALEGCVAERAFLPWVDMIALMRERELPLFTLESTAPVASCNLVVVALPHVLAVTNVLEALDLAGLPLRAAERGGAHPLVVGIGPVALNPEPLTAFFDAFIIGEAEAAIVEFIAAHRTALGEFVTEPVTQPAMEPVLRALAGVEGVYVPALYEPRVDRTRVPLIAEAPARVTRRLVDDLDALSPVTAPVVPFAEVVDDCLKVELSRGCGRRRRTCQTGAVYRELRTRRADAVVAAAAHGLAATGYGELALITSAPGDHPQAEEILRRLNHLLQDTDVKLSMASRCHTVRDVALMQLATSERRGPLSFAPMAGSVRLRSALNIPLTDDELIEMVRSAYAVGWRCCELRFLVGLPGERDEDVQAIAELARRAFVAAREAVDESYRGGLRMDVRTEVFVPRPHTPLQWAGQASHATLKQRRHLLKSAELPKGVNLRLHDPASARARIEAALARAGREAAALIEQAWQRGALFETERGRFDEAHWDEAAASCDLSIDELAERRFAPDEPLYWEHIDSGASREFLAEEFRRFEAALADEATSAAGSCSVGSCSTGSCEPAPYAVGGGERRE